MMPIHKRRTGLRIAAGLAAAGAAILTLTASECEQNTTFPAYVAEICNDNIDNDQDGLVDCKDPDCASSCAVSVSINPIASPIRNDTLVVTGSLTNATAVAIVNISPSGSPGSATISGNTWSAQVTNLSQRTQYTLTVVGSAGDSKDTATATFTRGD